MSRLCFFLIIFVIACTPEPEPLRIGEDACAHCQMVISDNRFGAELVTVKGKTYPFDAIECMAAFENRSAVDPAQVHSLWVTDFVSHKLISVREARLVQSENLRSPMGLNFAAVKKQQRDLPENFHSATPLEWEDVLQIVKQKWSR